MSALFDHNSRASPLSVPAAKTALLLLDYHNLFFTFLETGKVVIGVADDLRRWAESKGFLVVHCLIDIQRDTPPNVRPSENFKMIQNAVMKEPKGGENALETLPNERVVFRAPGHVSALKSDGIMSLFEERGIMSLVLCGIATSGVVLRTASPASDDGYVVTIIEDACTDRTIEKHKLILEVVQNQSNITTAAKFKEEWEKAFV